MRMWERYEEELRKAGESWQENDCPPDVTAVALATGLDPAELWDVVEGQRGWETHDPGYAYVVWVIAWELKGHPDWQAPPVAQQPPEAMWLSADGKPPTPPRPAP